IFPVEMDDMRYILSDLKVTLGPVTRDKLDKPALSQCDLNRKRCRNHAWRQSIADMYSTREQVWLFDVHSFPPNVNAYRLFKDDKTDEDPEIVLLDNTASVGYDP